ncbi:hypothetical protein KVR01_010555 [Diaporthe batatas]|uniref:uncharacterized protein n=1 Tax=Diaporthe batatas TaxID=748121 RepID=UPI001D04FC58|nr:uncharacterized protein KVR01_010555 [Diaporthe batatas]KAG8159918.1 hypothetical protein KVR01_010555 [Diaporthe batatas]
MEPRILPAASASGLSKVTTPAGSPRPSTASEIPLITEGAIIDVELQPTLDASIGINTCGWHEGIINRADSSRIGTAVTCASPATCASSSAYLACCIDQQCSSSVFNTGCLPYTDVACKAGTPGPATKCCTDQARPECQTIFWPTSPGAPGQTVFTMVDWCAPTSRAGSGILGTTPPPQTSTPPPLPQESGFLKAPAGTILELFLGAILILVLVAISCVIVARKVRSTRARELRANDSRSSVTVSASPGRPSRDHGIPLSTSPETPRTTGDTKMDRPRRGDIERGSAGLHVA